MQRDTTTAHPRDAPEGPWNPGVQSPLPLALRHLCTIFRPANVFTSFAVARELRAISGLEYTELVAFRPERLALHELLVRVSADLSVPDGQRIEDLGINFRRITRDIWATRIEPQRAALLERYDAHRKTVAQLIEKGCEKLFAPGADAKLWSERAPERESDAHAAARTAERAARQALARTASAIAARHGRPWGTPDIVASIATRIACNDYAGAAIGEAIEPLIAEAVATGAYERLPRQARPVVMNTKGASASGKSTIRLLQRRLASDIGTRWSEFALISPDIWRKQLLDYDSLGDAYKYAGAFTGDELGIVDQKLDKYMARKAAAGGMSHLLIDRFRFDSFAPDSDVAGSNLLTRFGQVVYLFFMITPPASLVERAWNRGLDVGRYKSVDDTLAHGVEAYAGMPQLFFTWVQHSEKRVHFEFLDNSVAAGERPRTVAFGWNDTLTVLDVKRMLDVERYRRIDVNARTPEAVFPDESLLAPERNTGFLRECVARFREVRFADQDSGRVYLRLAEGRPVWKDGALLAQMLSVADTHAGLAAVDALSGGEEGTAGEELIAGERIHTVGRWGG